MGIVNVDFGKADRDAQQKLARLMGMIEARDAEFLGDPAKFYEQAGRAIHERDVIIRAAREALHIPMDHHSRPFDGTLEPLEVVRVRADELRALRACAEIVTNAKIFQPPLPA